MATLEKIRSKSVFLIIVIGVALLAFIVGDALTNSRNIFGDTTTVAKVGNTKIDITEYQRKREELNDQLEEARRQNPEQYANFDTQILPQLALNQLIQETLLKEAADRAGIRSTGNLLRYYMLENSQNPEVMKILRALNSAGIAAQTPQQAYEIIFNPKRNGRTDAEMEPYQRAWLAAEKTTGSQMKDMIYQRLLAGTVKANDLDKKALYNDYVATTSVDVAYLPFGQLDAKKYPVSDAEIQEAYNKDKELFKVDAPTREVGFIAVTVMPSAADRAAAQALAKKTVAALSGSKGALPKDIKKEGVSLTHRSLRASDIPAGPVKDYVLNAPADSVKLIRENIQGFTAVRMGARSTEVDSIQINVVSTATDRLGQRVMASLNGGLPVDSISVRFSADSVAPQLAQWIPLYGEDGPTNALPQSTLDSLVNAGGKFISLQAGPQGMVMAQLVKQNPPVTVYEFDEVEYTLSPSSKTLADETSKLEKFLGANNTAEKFAANAAKAGYNLQNFTLTANDPAVPRFQGFNQYYPDSRAVMRWIMIDGEEGQVSHIFESKSSANPTLYAVAIDSEYDEYAPVSNKNVREVLTDKVRRSKAGDKLVAQYSKKTQSLASAAQAMGVQPRNYDKFRFGANSGVSDPAVTGAIAGAKADKKVVIVKGEDGVYVYQVTGHATESFPFNDQMYEQQYYQLVNPNLVLMLQGNEKVKNNIYKFEAGE